MYTPIDEPGLDATKGERVFEIVDAKTFEVLQADRHGPEARRVRASPT